MGNDTVYLDIVPEQRIVLAYTMMVAGQRISVSLATVEIAPVFFGAGLRLFERVDRRKIGMEIVEAIHSPLVTHLRYVVKKR